MKESSEPPCKKLKSGILDDFSTNTYNDIFRTGAKPVNLTGDEVDPKLPGAEYHKVGIGRTKGGRGPESWSMSCSDKLVKWAHAGLQGGMLSNVFLGPITPKTFVFGPCKSDHGSVFRALSRIGNENVEFNFVENPEFKFSPKNVFKSRVNEKVKVVPCSSAIIWSIYSGGSEQLEGKRGVKHGTGKSENSLKNRKCHSNFAPKYLLERFKTLPCAVNLDWSTLGSYRELKSNSTYYNLRVKEVEEKISWKKHDRILDEFEC